MTSRQDSPQPAREREALVKIRAHLDEQERNRPLGSMREAILYMATALPLVVGTLLLVALLGATGLYAYLKAVAPRAPVNRAEYAAAVFSKAEDRANRARSRSFDGLRGSVEVSFHITSNGRVGAIKVLGPPRDNVMEAVALSLIKTAEPFGEFPAEAGYEPMTLRGTWQFGGPGVRAVLAPHAAQN